MANNNQRGLFGGDGNRVTDWSKPEAGDSRQDALGNKIPEPEEELHLMDREIHELKLAFEQYFSGADRKSPVRRRDQLFERLRKLKNADIKMSTGVKFRMEQTWSKLSALDRVWARSLLERESGTYSRDQQRAKLRADPESVRQVPVARPTRPSLLSDGQLRTLYDTYVMARRRTNESTDNLTLQSLTKHLDKQVPQMLKQFDCKAVDFKVVIKNGKTVLKAIPRK